MELRTTYPFTGLAGRIFFDSWMAMLATGGLGHQLHQPALYHFSYWNFVLLVIAIQALWGTDRPDYKLVFKPSKKEKK